MLTSSGCGLVHQFWTTGAMLQRTISTNVTAKSIFCLAIPRVTRHVKRSVKTDYINESGGK